MGKNDPKKFAIKEKQLFCPICGYDKFGKDAARVEKGVGKFRPDWEAITLTCEECRHIVWFEDGSCINMRPEQARLLSLLGVLKNAEQTEDTHDRKAKIWYRHCPRRCFGADCLYIY